MNPLWITAIVGLLVAVAGAFRKALRWWRQVDDPRAGALARSMQYRQAHLEIADQLAQLGESDAAERHREFGNRHLARKLAMYDVRDQHRRRIVVAVVAILAMLAAIVFTGLSLVAPTVERPLAGVGLLFTLTFGGCSFWWLKTWPRFDDAINAAAQERTVWIQSPDTIPHLRTTLPPWRELLRTRVRWSWGG